MATALHSRRMQRLKMHSVMHCTCILPAFRLHQLPVGTALSFAILCVATQAAPCARWTTDHSSSSCAVIQPQGTSAAGSSEHTACAAAVHTLIGTIVAYVETVCALFYTSMLERLPETATCETVCMLSRYALSTAGGLGDIAYVPDFITAEEEAHLLQDIRCSKAKWTVVGLLQYSKYGEPWNFSLNHRFALSDPASKTQHPIYDNHLEHRGLLNHVSAHSHRALLALGTALLHFLGCWRALL